MTNLKKSTSYKDSGVNIEKASELVTVIKNMTQNNQDKTLSDIGGFSALFEIPAGYRQPVLASGTDGVGTKLLLAKAAQQHHGIGIDLVAMCVNDVICCGAKPLFFLDYYATGQLELDHAQTILKSIIQGCEQAQLTLVGGETAELPGLYPDGDYDLAGFCVGIVEKDQILSSQRVQPGDKLIGLGSSGAHANGYALIRHVIAHSDLEHQTPCDGDTLINQLLQPTTIYVNTLLPLLEQHSIQAMAHITGGGILENLPRALPENTVAVIKETWQRPELFQLIQQQGHIDEQEMWRSFNLGIGMVLCVRPEHVDTVLNTAATQQQSAWVIGEVHASSEVKPSVKIINE